LRILVIDDNETNLRIFRKYLEYWQCRSEELTSAETGLQLLHNVAGTVNEFDAVLVDCQMPDLDGITFARNVLDDPALRHNKIIMLSSIADIIRPDELTDAGFRGFLNKPVKIMDLRKVILKAIRDDAAQPVPEPLPAREIMPQIRQPDELPADSAGEPSVSVLLVEDNKINQRIAMLNLHQQGYAVELAENGEEALDWFQRKKFDLIFMDVQMPVMDGLEATRRIRQLEMATSGNQPVHIIAMTANAMKGDREICLAAGMNDYISKPFRAEELRRVLSRWSTKA
jgi:CheY-like chemotaxis protein